MRRSPLKRTAGLRRVALKRKAPQRASHKLTGAELAAWVAFTEQTAGYCQCGCGRFCMWRENHHVIPQQTIKQENRRDMLWDVRNRMKLHPTCHHNHTSGLRHGHPWRIPLAMVPDSALAFGVDLFASKEEPDLYASDWFARNYAGDDGAPMEGWRP